MISAMATLFLTQTWQSYGKYTPPVAPYSLNTLPTEPVAVPMIFPVVGRTNWRDDYNSNRGSHRHTGIDIRAPKMTPIVAPFSGIFGNKIYSFWIYGDNGWRCLGTHLNDDTPGTNDGRKNFDFMFAPNLSHGDRVEAGQLIGYVGNSGDATGPHLHFEIHGTNGIRNPFQSLVASQRISEPRLKIGNVQDKPESQEERFIVCRRNWNSKSGSFYGILVAKQYDTGRVIVTSKPSFVSFRIPKDVEGQDQIESWPLDRPGSIYFAREGNTLRVKKVLPPLE